jgi:hypothetical protein
MGFGTLAAPGIQVGDTAGFADSVRVLPHPWGRSSPKGLEKAANERRRGKGHG